MWRSEEDVIKDLASLDDFGVPDDRESYQVLYSIGRGSRLHKKTENSKTFIDHRTGETIDIKAAALDLNDSCTQGKGRGSAIGSLSKTQFQLLKQLRMARPLGSGDEAIESYYRRNRPVENIPNSKPNTASVKIISDNKGALTSQLSMNNGNNKIRIKATRHSNLQSNALIEGLLSKAKKNAKFREEEQGGSSNFNSDYCSEKNNINGSVFPSDREKKEVSLENDSSTEIVSSKCDSGNFSDAENTDSILSNGQ